MPSFGQRSRDRIATLDERWEGVLFQVIEHYDFTIVCGFRDMAAQTFAFEQSFSTKQWPNSKHNVNPSLAVDIAPWHSDLPHIRWERKEEFIFLAGLIVGASWMNLDGDDSIRWGGDWDSDGDQRDQTFMDIGHFEIRSG